MEKAKIEAIKAKDFTYFEIKLYLFHNKTSFFYVLNGNAMPFLHT